MRIFSLGCLLVPLIVAPLSAQSRWPGRDRLEAEVCTPVKGDAGQWLRRADSATGLARLVQAFTIDQPASATPVDQIQLGDSRGPKVLMLPAGSYWARTIDRRGTVVGEARLTVER